jgi:hypothetical protein
MKMPSLYYAVIVFEGGVSGFGLWRFKQVSKPLKLLIILLIFWFCTSIIEDLTRQRNINNVWIGHINNLIEMVFFTWIYYIWRTSERNGKLLLGSLAFFVSILIVGFFTFEPFFGSDEVTWAISRLIQLSFGVNILLRILIEEKDVPWSQNAKLFTTSAFVLYSAGTFFLFSLFTPLLNASMELLRSFYQINWILFIFANLLFARALTCRF